MNSRCLELLLGGGSGDLELRNATAHGQHARPEVMLRHVAPVAFAYSLGLRLGANVRGLRGGGIISWRLGRAYPRHSAGLTIEILCHALLNHMPLRMKLAAHSMYVMNLEPILHLFWTSKIGVI